MLDLTNSKALQTLFDHLADAVYLIDPKTSTILWSNKQAWLMLGMQADELLNHSVLSLQKDIHGQAHWDDIAAAVMSEDSYKFIGRHVHKNNGEIDVEVLTTHFIFEQQSYFLSTVRDISQRIQTSNHFSESEKGLLFALHESSDGFWDWNIADSKVVFSDQLKRLLGYGPDEMGNDLSTWKNNVHPDDTAMVLANLEEHLSGQRQRYEAEYRLRNRNGHYLWVKDRGKVCERDAQGTPLRVVGLVHDITHQKINEAELQTLASYDSLTGLLNRRVGMEQLKVLVTNSTTLSIAFIDIDFFKQVNDVHGHATGDIVLKLIAQSMQKSIRPSDILCRWGGEEFILIADNTSFEQMLQLTETLRNNVKSDLAASDYPITVSAGVTSALDEDVPALLGRADLALYNAKTNGRDRTESLQN